MSNETKKTEQLIQIYKEDPVLENFKALVHQMRKTVFLVPAMLPDTPEAEELRKIAQENPGQQAQLPKGIAPLPAILKSQKDETFFPIYTSPAQFPKDTKFELVMNMSFKACYTFALDAKLDAKGMALNPFSDNLLFKKEMLEAIQKEDKANEAKKKGVKELKVTPKQFKVMMRQKAEFHDFPFRVFKEGGEFIQKLSDEKEAVVHEIYRNAYQKPELYPYEESDFSVMPLNISEELLLVRVDLPKVKAPAMLCYRIYVTWNPKNNAIHYFTIEKGKEKGERNLGGVSSNGQHIAYGEAPVEGAEIQRILDLVEQEKEQTS